MEIRAARRGFVLGGVAVAAAACTPDDAQPPQDSPGAPVSPDALASPGTAPTSADWHRLARTVSGTLAPGNSIGTLTVNGNFVQAAGSTYQVEANA